jgi:hypothetical protein
MLRVQRRIEKLEHASGLGERFAPYVHQLNFIDGDGTVTGTMVLSSDPGLRVPYRDLQQNAKDAE